MRILWAKTELLHPIDKGGKIRTYQMLRELKHHHEITYLTLDDGTTGKEEIGQAEEYCHHLVRVPFHGSTKFTWEFYRDVGRNLFSHLPYAVEKYRSPGMRQEIRARTEFGGADVLVCDFLAPALNVPAYLPCPIVLFEHNVEAMIWQRHTITAPPGPKKLYFWLQWRRMATFEAAACRRVQQVVAVSSQDRQALESSYGLTRVSEVPTGVDVEYFRPSASPVRNPKELVFVGSMDWLPNDDAAHYFTSQILPVIRRVAPDVTLTVAGRNPYRRLRELAQRDPAIRVTGTVADVRPYMERASVFVLPLRIGGGTRLKVFEAMAMEIPIVSTSIGVEGLPIQPGVDVLVADTHERFAEAVLELLRNRERARAMAERAASRVRAEFGWERVADRFADICGRTIERWRQGRSAAATRETAQAVPPAAAGSSKE